MRRPRRQFVERCIREARRLWGLDEQWVIGFRPVNTVDVEGTPTHIAVTWTEKRATIEYARNSPMIRDRKRFRRDIIHEVGHLVLAPIWQGVTDWMDDRDMLPEGTRERRVFEEMFNTRENEVIDFIVGQVFKL